MIQIDEQKYHSLLFNAKSLYIFKEKLDIRVLIKNKYLTEFIFEYKIVN